MHSLTLEHSPQIIEYLQKVEQAIEKVKVEAYEKLKRKILFNSGIDFHSTEDPDENKRIGAEKFKKMGLKVEVEELNLDKQQLAEIKAKKEQILREQQKKNERNMGQSNSSGSLESADTATSEKPEKSDENNEVEQIDSSKKQDKKEKKQKKKKKKNKGIADFMEDESEAAAYQQESQVNGTKDQAKESEDVIQPKMNGVNHQNKESEVVTID